MANPILLCSLFLVVFLSSTSVIADDADEVRALLSFKSRLIDEIRSLQSWEAGAPCSSWAGISCNTAGKVIQINLSAMNLSGTIHSSVCELPMLSKLSLDSNLFEGEFPSSLLAAGCGKLEWLELQKNSFLGSIPSAISNLTSLRYLDLSNNAFTGPLPAAIGDLSELRNFTVWNNRLQGPVPPEIGKLQRILNLTLSWNSFGPDLPPEITNLSSTLVSFRCGGCNLAGRIPPWIGKLRKLQFLELTYNGLTGALPDEIGDLIDMRQLDLYCNSLSGAIPESIANLTRLTDLDLNSNFLTGAIPDRLFNIPTLSLIHLWNNSLTGSIPAGISRLPELYDVALFLNNFSGGLPPDLGSRCQLEIFDVSSNRISGEIPATLCNGGKLWRLMLFSNQLTGGVPEELAGCRSLIRVRIQQNMLSGSLPAGLWSHPEMVILDVSDNRLNGSVDGSIGGAHSLHTLRIFGNQIGGSIPIEIGRLKNLSEFIASDNALEGRIPGELGGCEALSTLYLDKNTFSGSIPAEVGSLSGLQYLNLAGNELSGSIPGQIGGLSELIWLDLSENDLSGAIPPELSKLTLSNFVHFNLSYNRLSGKVPFSVETAFRSAFEGNPGLCSGSTAGSDSNLNSNCAGALPDGGKKWNRRGMLAWIAGCVLAFAAVASFVGSWWFYSRYRALVKKQGLTTSRELMWTMTLYQKIWFTEQDVLVSLDEDNLIGYGGSGKVYKATMLDGQAVAVKKLWHAGKDEKTGDYGFRAEVESLGRIRHKNIVRLLCCVSNGETNILVYDYVANGSLGDMLHSSKACVLDWPTRYRIALGAAQGLCYLHHDCIPQILHRDVKSNNILLNENFDGLLADFGLAKLLDPDGQGYSISSLTGSLGYMAPEYAHKLKVSDKSDVYSFGVVLLELLTGRRPVDEGFEGEGMDIVRWVCSRIQSQEDVVGVFDKRMTCAAPRELMQVLKIALRCTSELPSDRPSMRDVVQLLKNIDTVATTSSSSEDDDHRKEAAGKTAVGTDSTYARRA